jgi:hypothetical protein
MSKKGGSSLRVLPIEGNLNLNINLVWNQREVALVITNYHLTWAKIKEEMRKRGYKPFIIRGRRKSGKVIRGNQILPAGSKFLVIKSK